MTAYSMDRSLLVTLQIHNPWLERPGEQAKLLTVDFPSPFLPRSRRLVAGAGRAELVVGPRQAGKSTWIRHSLSGQTAPVLILHAEEPRVRELCRSPAEALHALQPVLSDDTLLVLEEVQHLADAPLFIKGLVDLQPRRRIVVTGSSSFQFQSKTTESLAGRARRTLMLPFSMEEISTIANRERVAPIVEEELRSLWSRLLVFGGYPRPWFDPEPVSELHRLAESFVLKDASDLHTIDRPDAFRKLLELAAADVGNLVNLSAWASHAGVSRDTVARYLEIAADAHILRLVPPFRGGKRAEITGTPKVYLIDNGLRNTLFAGFGRVDQRADAGALWENAVFSELLKRTRLLDEIYFWRTKNGAEVDFVVRRDQKLLALQVKSGMPARPQLGRAARSFIRAYRPECFGVINGSINHDDTLDGVPIRYRRPWEIGELLKIT